MIRNIIIITILTLFIFNCSENVREDITERYSDGHKKVLVKYKGEGESEKLIEKMPNDPEYYLYLGSTYGIRARTAIAGKEWLNVLYYGYQGLKYIRKAQSMDNALMDVYMPIGLMEYFSCMASSPVRLAAKVVGITPDCELGISHLEDAVSGGGYSRIEAGNALTYIYLYFLNQPEDALKHINPLSDEKLAELLGKDDYHIARRTVAKYRENLRIQTAKLRREL